MYRVNVQEDDFDIGAESAEINRALCAAGMRDIGAIASFVGMVREQERRQTDETNSDRQAASADADNAQLTALEIEHYPAMTQRTIEEICQRAAQRWPLLACRVIHRVGRVAVGEQIVLVLVASEHRKAAFAACEYIMDFLKTAAPFWKKAIFSDGEQWIEAKKSDNTALDKWQ